MPRSRERTMAGGGGESSVPLEYTPTWVVAAVCSVIVVISLLLERALHILGKYLLKKKKQKALFEALLKVKEELMLLGFISLLLTVFQGSISRICIPEHLTRHMLPCKKEKLPAAANTAHFQSFFSFSGISSGGRRLLAQVSEDHCAKVSSLEKELDELIAGVETGPSFSRHNMGDIEIEDAPQHGRSRLRTPHFCGKVPLLSIEALHQLHIFIFVLAIVHVVFCLLTMILGSARIYQWKHWEDSIAKENYDTNIETTCLCKLHDELNNDFSNLLLAVGTKLEHVIIQLAHEVAEKHTAIEGDLIVQPSDDHFWFNRPKIVLYLIHFILFQNAFEIAFFFWILMGSSFKKAIFDEHVQEGLLGWAQKVKKRKGAGTKVVNTRDSSSHVGSSDGSSLGIQLQNVGQRQSTIEEGTVHPSAASKSA
ncbi:hypothetical protein ACLOJK_011613 [Asimina triloba]